MTFTDCFFCATHASASTCHAGPWSKPRTLTLSYFPKIRFADRLTIVPEEYQANAQTFAIEVVIGPIFCMLSPIAALVILQWQRAQNAF